MLMAFSLGHFITEFQLLVSGGDSEASWIRRMWRTAEIRNGKMNMVQSSESYLTSKF